MADESSSYLRRATARSAAWTYLRDRGLLSAASTEEVAGLSEELRAAWPRARSDAAAHSGLPEVTRPIPVHALTREALAETEIERIAAVFDTVVQQSDLDGEPADAWRPTRTSASCHQVAR